MRTHQSPPAAQRRWRVLLVVDTLEVGGAERHVVDLALALRAEGHHVVVACGAGGPLLLELRTAGVRVRIVMKWKVKRRVDIIFALELRRILAAEDFDLIHAHGYASSAAAALAASHAAVALVITVHSEGAWQGRISGSLAGLTYRQAGAVIAVSQPIAWSVIRRHRVPATRVMVIGNSVVPMSVPPPVNGTIAAHGRPLIAVVARLHREKGVDLFLDALARVLPSHSDMQSLVIGDGPLRTSLTRRAGYLGLNGHIRFLGCRPDARDLMPSFDVLVVPSRTEGTPLVVPEAMAAGIAVIATRVGGLPEQIRDGVDGLLVPPENPQALADGIQDLLQNPERRRRLALEGRRCVDRRFPFADMVRRVEEAYALALVRTRG